MLYIAGAGAAGAGTFEYPANPVNTGAGGVAKTAAAGAIGAGPKTAAAGAIGAGPKTGYAVMTG